MDSILGRRPATCPRVTIDSSSTSTSEALEDNEEIDEETDAIESQYETIDQKEFVSESPSDNSAGNSSSTSFRETRPCTPTGPLLKKRKVSKSETAVKTVRHIVN